MSTQTSPFTPLLGENYASLTTFRKSGVAVATAMWFAIEGDIIYIYTGSASGKVKRIRHTSRVTLAPCTSSGKVTGAVIEATARISSDPQEIARAEAALAGKYRWQRRILYFIRGIFQRQKNAGAYLIIEPQA